MNKVKDLELRLSSCREVLETTKDELNTVVNALAEMNKFAKAQSKELEALREEIMDACGYADLDTIFNKADHPIIYKMIKDEFFKTTSSNH